MARTQGLHAGCQVGSTFFRDGGINDTKVTIESRGGSMAPQPLVANTKVSPGEPRQAKAGH